MIAPTRIRTLILAVVWATAVTLPAQSPERATDSPAPVPADACAVVRWPSLQTLLWKGLVLTGGMGGTRGARGPEPVPSRDVVEGFGMAALPAGLDARRPVWIAFRDPSRVSAEDLLRLAGPGAWTRAQPGVVVGLPIADLPAFMTSLARRLGEPLESKADHFVFAGAAGNDWTELSRRLLAGGSSGPLTAAATRLHVVAIEGWAVLAADLASARLALDALDGKEAASPLALAVDEEGGDVAVAWRFDRIVDARALDRLPVAAAVPGRLPIAAALAGRLAELAEGRFRLEVQGQGPDELQASLTLTPRPESALASELRSGRPTGDENWPGSLHFDPLAGLRSVDEKADEAALPRLEWSIAGPEIRIDLRAPRGFVAGALRAMNELAADPVRATRVRLDRLAALLGDRRPLPDEPVDLHVFGRMAFDGWGRPIRCESLPTGGLRLSSLGRDGRVGGEGEDADLESRTR